MNEKLPLKDLLFNEVKLGVIARQIKNSYPQFEEKKFLTEVLNNLKKLELKERINLIANCLKKYLPSDYEAAVEILLKSLPAPLDENLSDNDFGDFIYAPYSHFIAQNGLNKKHLQFSLDALMEITQRFSCEYAIRHFINSHPKTSLNFLHKMSLHKNYHIRRLCSEGTRPKLPWGIKISTDYNEALGILDNLFSDKTRFVTRSVANHLNDISKIDPKLVIAVLQKWKNSQKQNDDEMNFIIRHALRNLIKQGDKAALELLGIKYDAVIKLLNFHAPKNVKMNENLEFSFTLKSEKNCEAIVDYVISFQNKTQKKFSQKVFKLKKVTLRANSEINISKRHLFKENMTTRKLFRGQHHLEIKVNGKILQSADFELC